MGRVANGTKTARSCGSVYSKRRQTLGGQKGRMKLRNCKLQDHRRGEQNEEKKKGGPDVDGEKKHQAKEGVLVEWGLEPRSSATNQIQDPIWAKKRASRQPAGACLYSRRT